MSHITILNRNQLQAICDCLGDTGNGLTGSEIGKSLDSLRIDDLNPLLTKRYRLFEALDARQRIDGAANIIYAFILAVMDPIRYTGDGDRATYEWRITQLNKALAFIGKCLHDDGKIYEVLPVSTLDQAAERASRLRRTLYHRSVHSDVLNSCRAELLEDNYFHAVLEATKSVAQKIRDKTGIDADGSDLVDKAFGRAGGQSLPRLAFNSLRTKSEENEHNGLMSLIKGMFMAIRNPLAHDLKIQWSIEERDALDLLTFASMIHRRLDNAYPTSKL